MSSWSETYELVRPIEQEWKTREGMTGAIETSARAFEGKITSTFSSETEEGYAVFGVCMDVGGDPRLPIEVWIPYQKIQLWTPW